MTLLAPAALLGSLLLAIPVVVHLFRPRKMRPTPFSSLRWLKHTHQRLSRRIQWHRWLLFLLRAGCILLLVLALARPLVAPSGEARPTDRYVVLDVGRAMAYESPGLPAPLAKGRKLAGSVLAQSRPGDRTTLLFAGPQTRLAAPPSADPADALAAVRTAAAESADGSPGAALAVIRALAANGREGHDVELVFVTANRQHGWRQGDVQAFLKRAGTPARVQVIDVGPASPQNAWVADARLLSGREDYRVLRAEVACVGDVRQERSLRLSGIAGVGDDEQPVALTPGQLARVEFKIPAALSLSGQVAELRLAPPDALPGDDRWFLNLDAPWALRVLLIEPDGAGGRGAGLFLKTAAEALNTSGEHALDLVRRPAASVVPGDVQRADVIVLAGVPDLPDAALEAVEARVRAGAGAVVFLGPGLNTAFYNQKLFRALQPADGLLASPLKSGQDGVVQGRPGQLTGVRWTHPLLAPLHDPLHGDLTVARFRRYAAFAAAPGAGDTVLARLDDAEPALVERPLGAGRVLLWNTTADDEWSDLLRRRSFVPLVDRMLSYLTAGAVRRQFFAGESVTLPLPDGWNGDVTVTAPSGEKLTPRLQKAGGRTLLHLDAVTEPGAYRVERSGSQGGLPFVANVRRDASPLSAMDTQTLKQWWAPATVEVLDPDAAAARYAERPGSWPLWPALVLAACLLLLVETVYVHRLCPRLSSSAAQPVAPAGS